MDILNTINIGTCYYPEHWPKERWQEDIDNMADMGLSVVRIGELAWSEMEKRDNEFSLDWLKEFVKLAGKKGIKTILGTPQEEMPVWLRNSRPDIIRVDENGDHVGGRGFCCKNNMTFRFYAARITSKMAEEFGNNPDVAGWQIDNELHGIECYCPSCEHAFQVWLRKKYGTIENINSSWGTVFWSQNFNSFEEIKLPAKRELTSSVSQILDFKRFASDTAVDFQNEQADIIRKYSHNQFISHNSLGLYPNINMYDAAKNLDVMAWDVYPNVDDDYINVNKGHDLIRATKHDNYWMLEQKNGYINYSDYNLAIKPGLVRAWGYLDISRGANGVLYYRYRANRWGKEQNPNGILRHDGSKRRAYYEIQQLTRELAPIREKLGKTKTTASVAIIHNYDDIWASQAHNQYKYFDTEKLENDFYKTLLRMGVTADLIHPEDGFSGYKIVIAPNLMLLSQKTADNLTHFAEAGGTVIFHIRCGQKNTANAMVDIPWPGLVRDLCGITVDEFEAFPGNAGNSVDYLGKSYPVRWWADILDIRSAVAEAVYEKDFYAGKPAVTSRKAGKGRAVYFGAAGCAELIGAYLEKLLGECGIPVYHLPEKVFITERKSDYASYTFILNMGYREQEINIDIQGVDLITGGAVKAPLRLMPLQTMIVESKN
ncbi:MAG: beta-galactosidase [Treponema sp.]|nr:beta-galactosidase [Treponema sp.]